MSSRRVFTTVTAAVVVLIIVFVSASLLGVGGNAFEDAIHNVAEVVAGLFAGGMALVTAIQSRGRRRASWLCWGAFGLLQAVCDWNALAAHHAAIPSVANIAFIAQLPIGLIAALIFMRVMSSRLAVTVAFCDGLLMGGALLIAVLATGYVSVFGSSNSILVNIVSLAQPVGDVVVLTLVATVVARVGVKGRPVGILISAAILGIGIADLQLTREVSLGVTVPGSVFANGWVAGLLCLGIAALYALCFRRQPEPVVVRTTTPRTGLWVPILPVAVTCALAVALRLEPGPADRAVAVGHARAHRPDAHPHVPRAVHEPRAR